MRIFILSLIALTIFSGCATNTMTGRSQLMIVNESAAINKSANMYSAYMGKLNEDGKLLNDSVVLDRVKGITNRLVERAIEYRPESVKWEWQVNVVIDDDMINASCMPGGKMVLYTGLINKINPTDDELAQVMSHEIAHALAKHGAEKMSVAAVGAIAAATVAAVAAANDNSQSSYQRRRNMENYQMAAALGAAAFITLPNSRTTESEADRMGVEIAARAGYDPAASITLWEKMAEASGQKSRGDFMSTHPSPVNRIEALGKLQEPMREFYEDAKKIYTADYKPKQEYVQMNAWHPPTVAYNENDPEVSQLKSSLNSKSFYSKEFDDFKNGKTELTCESCGTGFFLKQGELKRLAESGDWKTLQKKVLSNGYKLDLGYLYLGMAAEGLGYPEASKHYFRMAEELSSTEEFSCAKGRMINCQGYDIQSLTSMKLAGDGASQKE